MEDLAQQEIKLTYCFYENPAAKQEIKFWESLVEKHIVSKSFIGDNWGYRLEKEDGTEFVCCIPLQQLKRCFDLDRTVKKVFELHKYSKSEMLKYNKVLIFGKVEIEQLTWISTMMHLWEK